MWIADSTSIATAAAATRREAANVVEHVHALFDRSGGTLRCPESGVELRVPPGAIATGRHDFSLKVAAPFAASSGPLIIVGPQDFCFSTPAELRLPHPTAACSRTRENGGEAGASNFSLKSGATQTLRDVELVAPPVANERFISVLIERL